MAPIIPQITCRRCQRQYSALRGRCPYCGTRKTKQSQRTVANTASVKEGTAANTRAVSNSRWQFVFGVIVLVAVIATVIALISMSLGDGASGVRRTPTPTITMETESPTFTPTPAPPTPLPVTSINLQYAGNTLTQFMAFKDQATPIDAVVYPIELAAVVTWSVGDDSIIRIERVKDNTVNVTGVGSGKTTLTAECGGVKAEIDVYVQ